MKKRTPADSRPSKRRTFLVEGLENRLLLSTGSPDPTFGTGGQVLTQFTASGNDIPLAVAAQSNGQILVAGTSNEEVAIARYNTNGTLDTTFGTGGEVLIPSPVGGVDSVQAMAIQSDGKIVLAGYIDPADQTGDRLMIMRLNTTGSLDTTFDSTGIESFTISGTSGSKATAVSIQSNGEIVAAGSVSVPNDEGVLVRVRSNGGLDPTFGTNGVVINSQSGSSQFNSIQIDSAGRLVTAGEYSGAFGLSRFLPNGLPDTTFGTDGVDANPLNTTPGSADSMAFTSSGEIIVAGEAYNGSTTTAVMACFTATGTLDPTFGSDGVVFIDRGTITATSVAINPANQYVFVAGDSTIYSEPAFLAAFTATGRVDIAFPYGMDGSSISGFSDITVLSNNSIVAAGATASTTTTSQDFFLENYTLPFGTSNSAFGNNGTVETDFIGPTFSSNVRAVVQSDGKIVVGSATPVPGQGSFENDIVLTRYNANGQIDDSFGTNGSVASNFSGAGDDFGDLAIESNGDIVVVGLNYYMYYNYVVVARYLPSGQLDSSFGSGGTFSLADFSSAGDILTLEPNGEIVVAGTKTDGDWIIAELTTDGAIVPSFGSVGYTETDLSSYTPAAIAIDSMGRIMVTGSDPSQGSIATACYTPSGVLDSTFGSGGIVTTSFSDADAASQAIALQNDGKIVVAGYLDSGQNDDFAVLRYNSDGSLDSGFGNNGVVTTPIGPGSTESDISIEAVSVLADGSLLVAGDGGSSNIVLARYQSNGTLDTTFGSDGLDSLTFGDVSASVSSMNILPNGSILLAGQATQTTSPYGTNEELLARLIGFPPDTIAGTSGVDNITLAQDADGQHIDWTMGTMTGQMLIDDPSGLTINGNGSDDVITLDYGTGDKNPLPNILHLNGTFTIDGLQTPTGAGGPLAGTTLDIEKSTVYLNYGSPANDPLTQIRGYLAAAYANGAWTGTSSDGVITSTAARTNSPYDTIAYIDSADGTGLNTAADSVELRYTVQGDANLDGQVSLADLQTVTRDFNAADADSALGDMNFDGQVSLADLQLVTRNFNAGLASQSADLASQSAEAGIAAPAGPLAADTDTTAPREDAANASDDSSDRPDAIVDATALPRESAADISPAVGNRHRHG